MVFGQFALSKFVFASFLPMALQSKSSACKQSVIAQAILIGWLTR
jgi:hypothetical protein